MKVNCAISDQKLHRNLTNFEKGTSFMPMMKFVRLKWLLGTINIWDKLIENQTTFDGRWLRILKLYEILPLVSNFQHKKNSWWRGHVFETLIQTQKNYHCLTNICFENRNLQDLYPGHMLLWRQYTAPWIPIM